MDCYFQETRIVIPISLQSEMLCRIHNGHQGIMKTREKTRQSMWSPGIGQQIIMLINVCPVCSKERYQHREPFPFPELPWRYVASDLFKWKKSQYLLVIDYVSRYIEIAKDTQTTSEDVVLQLKSLFARHGIPQVLRSENGPQYSSYVFSQFSKEY